MKTYRIKVWTGPTLALQIGRMMKRAHIKVSAIGTEHVYVDMKGTSCAAAGWNMLVMMQRKFRTNFGLRPGTCNVRPSHKRS